MVPHDSSIWAAVQQALNLSGVGALIAGLFLITKSKGDAKLTLAQLHQKTETDERIADQADVKLVSEMRIAAAAELEKNNVSIKEQRDYWERLWRASSAELEMRNKVLAEYGTNYAEMFTLMAVPGAMEALRSHQTTLRTTTVVTDTVTHKEETTN